MLDWKQGEGEGPLRKSTTSAMAIRFEALKQTYAQVVWFTSCCDMLAFAFLFLLFFLFAFRLAIISLPVSLSLSLSISLTSLFIFHFFLFEGAVTDVVSRTRR